MSLHSTRMLHRNTLRSYSLSLMEDITIARRRFIRPQENKLKLPRSNDRIRAKTVRLIDQDETMIGIVSTSEALDRARAADLDLVEVSPGSDPPVCRILDFGKYRYEQSKKERANRAKTKVVETKEVRLGRSMKIDPHDIEIRLNQARKFLLDGHKVLIVQNFRGREMMHKERGHERMQEIIAKLSDISKVELSPRMAGRRQTMVLAPDKTKIKKVLASAKAKAEKDNTKAQDSNE
ncbi:MAG: translation initiation factor IF-3 [Phycisphaerales bacterium]|nr:translation initiation factor IF-3 [Phycisphaerales bacterium]